jgi:predicted MFS family arabinose efflux permease
MIAAWRRLRVAGPGAAIRQDGHGAPEGGSQAARERTVSANRWSILAGYGLLTGCTQLLWLSYAAITSDTQHGMGVSEGAVGDLAVVFPLVYVVLALPSGRWLDANFGRALSTGALLTGAGGLLRVVEPNSYVWAFAGQCVIAAGQPLVLNAITKTAARYFPPAERTTAVSVGSVAMFLGVLVAVLSGRPLFDAGGLRLVDWTQAGLALVAVGWVVLAVRVPAGYQDDATVTVTLGWLKRDRFMWLLGGLLFIGMGEFNAVATWLESILDHFGRGNAAGWLIAIMTGAGIAGAGVLPAAVARPDRRRTLLIAVVLVTAAAFAAIAAGHNVGFVAGVLFVEGFVMLAALPVVLDWSELHAGAERAASAVGFLLLAGNLGGIVLTLLVQLMIDNAYASLITLSVVALSGVSVAIRLPARAESPLELTEMP